MTKAQAMTTSTRAIGMADFKVNLPSKNRRFDSHYKENYFLSKPDVWVHSIQRTDDIILMGNSAVFETMKVTEMVSKIKSKLAIGGSPNDLAAEFNEQLAKTAGQGQRSPVLIGIILNMSLIDV